MIRVVIIDGQDQDRNNTALVLSAQSDLAVVGVGKDGYDALKFVGLHTPDILLMDAALSGIDIIKADSLLRRRSPHTAVIILTNLDDDLNALDALCTGVSGYLLKAKDMQRLAAVIRVVFTGGCYLSPYIAARVFPMVSRIAHGESPVTPDPYFPNNMSRTELQIIHHVGGGLENQEIAEKLCLKTGTIRNYVTEILQKTSLRNRVQLAVFAEQNGLIQSFPNTPAA
jgi:DNA-binding NarL/FixJ family response regulator